MGTTAETTTTAATAMEVAMTTVVVTTVTIVVVITLGIVTQLTGPNPSQRTKLWRGRLTHDKSVFTDLLLKMLTYSSDQNIFGGMKE